MLKTITYRLKHYDKLRMILFAFLMFTLIIGLINAYMINVNISDFYVLILYSILLFVFDLLYNKWIFIPYAAFYLFGLIFIYNTLVMIIYRFTECLGGTFFTQDISTLLAFIYVSFVGVLFVFMKFVHELKYRIMLSLAFLVLAFSAVLTIFQLDVYFSIFMRCFIPLSENITLVGTYYYPDTQNFQFLLLGIKDILLLLLLVTSPVILKNKE